MARWELVVKHEGLGKYQVIRGDDKLVVEQKGRATTQVWEEMWQRKQAAEAKRRAQQSKALAAAEGKAIAEERTREAQAALAGLERVLAQTLGVNDAVDWATLKDHTKFTATPPAQPAEPSLPPEPQETDPYYAAKLGTLDKLVGSRKAAREKEAAERFQGDHEAWEEKRGSILAEHQARLDKYEEELAAWRKTRDEFLAAQAARNAAIDAQKEDYQRGQAGAVVDYCDLVLAKSKYPDSFPQTYDVDYNPENQILVVDYQLPALSDLPTVSEVKYVQARAGFEEKHIPEARRNQIYNDVLYQVALRTIHELLEADVAQALAAVVFNGYVRSIDPATGQEINACILSVQAGKQEFERINLANVDPKVCFKSLKGIGSVKLQSMTPVAPIVKIEREDARFVDSYGVVDTLEEGYNLAAMDWEDFEHLIREVFEKEFSSSGGEVKVTRASRDGGIDAVVFDPDPIRGGKIVIQAKRYTGTVGVSYVRDLYGTVVNEGANKGILVTTAHYGPDAYEFAKGKPLALLDGNNLLHLLEKHGHKARIDLREAKRQMAGR